MKGEQKIGRKREGNGSSDDEAFALKAYQSKVCPRLSSRNWENDRRMGRKNR